MTPLAHALCIPLLLAAGGTLSPEAREGQKILDGLYWPAGITFKIADPTEAPTDKPIELPKTEGNGGEGGTRPSAAGARGTTGVRAGAGKPLATAGPSPPRPEELRIFELTRSIIEIGRAGMDLAKLTLARHVNLRPVLLFLVEQGVLTRAEMEVELAQLDLDRVMDLIAERTARLSQERDRLRVLLYLEEAR